MESTQISAIKQLLSSPKHVVIVPHKNPDGDALGSTLALYLYLLKNNHTAKIIAPNDFPNFLKWMPSANSILRYDTHTENCDNDVLNADIIFTLDFNALYRAGDMESVLQKSSAIKIMIDHHQSPDPYPTYCFSNVNASSTCEMVFDFIVALGGENHIDAEIATCIYTGIMTDTGSFKYSSTISKTHNIVALLIDKGANSTQIHDAIYDTNSYQRLQLLGYALQNLKVLTAYNTAFMTLSQAELNKFNFKKGDTEGFVNYGLSLENIVFAAIFIEDVQEQTIKISFRSKGNFSVNAFSRAHFNGGGHTNAAGGKSDLNLIDTVEKFINLLPKYKLELNNV